jgi:hypothetical protein
MWYQSGKDGPVDAVAAEMMDLVLHGARKRREAR